MSLAPSRIRVPASRVGIHTTPLDEKDSWRQRVCCRCGVTEMAPERQARIERNAGILSYPDYRCEDCRPIRFFR